MTGRHAERMRSANAICSFLNAANRF